MYYIYIFRHGIYYGFVGLLPDRLGVFDMEGCAKPFATTEVDASARQSTTIPIVVKTILGFTL